MSTDKKHSNMRWILFIAGRYLRSRRKDKKNLLAVLSIIGLAAGVIALISVISIMNALQYRTIEGILSFSSFHIKVEGPLVEQFSEGWH